MAHPSIDSTQHKQPPAPIVWSYVAFLIGTPLACAVLIPIHHVTRGFHPSLLVAAGVLWILTGIGITAGYHRLFSHKSYEAKDWFRALLLIFGAASWQNSVIVWSSNHRYHHRYVDTDNDPYNAKRGFWFSHLGWLMRDVRYDDGYTNVPDLWNDPLCRLQHTYYWPLNLGFNVCVPILIGSCVDDIAGMLLYAGLVRIVVVHHFTFTINSFAHIWGQQTWSQQNTSRDNWILSLVSFGEGYHNFHHTFETDYRNGPRWYNYDPSKWLIWCLSLVGVTRKLRRTPDKTIQRLLGTAPMRHQPDDAEFSLSK